MPKTTTSKTDDGAEGQGPGQMSTDSPAENPQCGQGSAANKPQTARPADGMADFKHLCARANRGDRVAKTVLVNYLDKHPEFWDQFGDIAGDAETALVEQIAPKDWLTRVAIRRKADEMRRQLSRPGQTPLEDLAVRRLVACWVQMQFVESNCARADGGLEQAKSWLQRQQQVHKLYAAAEKSLLMVRTFVPTEVQPAAIAAVGVGANPSAAKTVKAEEQPSGQAESPSLAVSEGPLAEPGTVNRIARWMQDANEAPENEEAGVADENHRVNGHVAKGPIGRGSR